MAKYRIIKHEEFNRHLPTEEWYKLECFTGLEYTTIINGSDPEELIEYVKKHNPTTKQSVILEFESALVDKSPVNFDGHVATTGDYKKVEIRPIGE